MANGNDQPPQLDNSRFAEAIAQMLAGDKIQNQVPLLTPDGAFTGEFYDRREGSPADQPNPDRFKAYLDFMRQRQPGRKILQQGKNIPGFQHVDPYSSDGGFDLSSVLGMALDQSITGDIEKLIDSDDTANLFGLTDLLGIETGRDLEGFQPNTVEQIGSGVLSFFMPADIATLALGGAGIGAKGGKVLTAINKVANIKKVGGLGYRLAPSVIKGARAAGVGIKGQRIAKAASISGSALGTYEATRALAQGRYADIPKDFTKGAAFGTVMAMAGGILPSAILEAVPGTTAHKLAESALGMGAIKGGVEIATFGTMSGVLEGRLPTQDDYIHAAGFVLGMKAMSLPGELKQRGHVLRLRAQAEEFAKAERNFEEKMEAEVDAEMQKGSAFNYKPIQEAKDGTRTLFRVGDVITGTRARKMFEKVLDVDVVISSESPTGEPGKTGWTTYPSFKDVPFGLYGARDIKLTLNPEHPESMAITFIHEAVHANQLRSRGVTKEFPASERTAKKAAESGKFERRVVERAVGKPAPEGQARLYQKEGGEVKGKQESITPDDLQRRLAYAEPKPIPRITPGRLGTPEGGRAPKQESIISDKPKPKVPLTKGIAFRTKVKDQAKNNVFRRKLDNGPVTIDVKSIDSEVGGGVQTLLKAELPQGTKTVAFTAIPAKVSSNSTMFGKGRAGMVVAEVKTKENGGTSLTVVELPRNKVQAQELLDKAFATAKETGKKLYVSKKLAKTGFIKGLAKTGVVKKVGSRLQVQSPATPTKPAKSSEIAYRSIVQTGDMLGPKAKKALEYWDKATRWTRVWKQYRHEFTVDEALDLVGKGRTGEQGVLDVLHNKGTIIAGKHFEDLNNAFRDYAISKGVKNLKPGVFDFSRGTAKLRKIGKQFYDDLVATDHNGNGPLPEVRKIMNDIAAEIKSVNPNFARWIGDGTGDKGYAPRIINSEKREQLTENLDELVNDLKKLPDNTPDKQVLQAIASRNGLLREGVEYVLKHNKHITSVRQAFRELIGQTIREGYEGPSFLKKRTLEVPSQWIERDARKVLVEYITDASRYVAQAREWGPHYEKLTEIVAKVRMNSRAEADNLSLLLARDMGIHVPNDRWGKRTRDVLAAYTGFQVATKIGLGGATLLNLGQPLISIIPDLGVWNTLRGGMKLFDPKYRAELRKSGLVNSMEMQAWEAVAGERPGGIMGELADRFTRISGFQHINKGLLYLGAASMAQAIPKWQMAAKGSGRAATYAQKRLKDFNIDWKKGATKDQKLEAMIQFARTSQLQKDMLRDPRVVNDPKFRTFFLFKRFGLRQASYMGDMIRREVVERKNPMPLIRLAAGGYLGGAGVVWALNSLKTLMSGEEHLRDDDGLMDQFITNITTVGALGMLGDIGVVNKMSEMPRAIQFAFTPVIIADGEQLLANTQKFLDDRERYGDTWFALKRNAYRLTDFFGTWPRAGGKQYMTLGQKDRRKSYQKGRQTTQIWKLIAAGETELAGDRLNRWNDSVKDRQYKLTATDFSISALRKWLERSATAFAEADAEKDTPEFRRIERAKLKELLRDVERSGFDRTKFRQGIRR